MMRSQPPGGGGTGDLEGATGRGHGDPGDPAASVAGPQLDPGALRALLDHSSDLITVVDAAGRCTYASPAVLRMSGFEPDEVIGLDASISMHPDDREPAIARAMEQLTGGAPPEPIVFRQTVKDGSFRHVEALVSRLPAGHPLGVAVITTRDITERVEAERVRKEGARIVHMVAAGAPLTDVLEAIAHHVQTQLAGVQIAVLRVTEDGETLRLACSAGLPPSVAGALDGIDAGFTDGSCCPPFCPDGSGIVADLANDDRWPRLRDAAAVDGLHACWSAPVISAGQGTVLGALTLCWQQPHEPVPSELRVVDEAVSIATVAFERNRIEEELAFRATHDSLTRLPNRTLLDDRIVQVLARRRRGEIGPVNVLFLDLDRFKEVNDRFGHAAGDALLIEVAGRLQATVREVDTVARFGGDEFVVVGVADEPDTLARRINRAVSEPFVLEGQPVRVSCSIGISTTTSGTDEPESLIREADLALYEAKRSGRNCFAHFEAVQRKGTTRVR